VLSGAELVYIAAGVPTYGFSLYSRADVKDVPSLKGKVVGLMTKGASTDHGMTALLRQYNLRSGQDVKILYLGGVREGLAALDRGIVAATTISAPTTLMARRLGYKELVNFATLKIPYVQLGMVSRRSLLRQQPEQIKAFLRAYIAAIKVVNEDADVSKLAGEISRDHRWADHRGGLPSLSRHLSQSTLHDRRADRFDPGGRGSSQGCCGGP
jgi:ABC-type nitrate/sulfonate/bicarbonate transport system substrate-binding protein